MPCSLLILNIDMWLILAFLSAAFLGIYDSLKKKALRDNAVIPILFLNTLFSSFIFLPFIILSEYTEVLDGSIFHVGSGGWEVHKYIVFVGAGLLRNEASTFDNCRSYQCYATCHGADRRLTLFWRTTERMAMDRCVACHYLIPVAKQKWKERGYRL